MKFLNINMRSSE